MDVGDALCWGCNSTNPPAEVCQLKPVCSADVPYWLQEALEKANAAASLSLSGRNQIPAPASSKQQQRPGSASKGKPVAPRGGAPAQRGRMGPRPGRGGPPGQQRNLPQPHSRGPTPPPRPSGELSHHRLICQVMAPSSHPSAVLLKATFKTRVMLAVMCCMSSSRLHNVKY